MSPAVILLGLSGLAVLTLGAEILVRGASRLAGRLGVPPLIVGLTVVAFGTSSPEMAVSLQASVTGSVSLGLGNVVGSNVFNVLFILGASAIVAPLIVNRQLVRLDVPVMIGVSMLPILLGQDGSLSRFDGSAFLVVGAAYTAALAYLGFRARRTSAAESEAPAGGEPGGAPGPGRSASPAVFGGHWAWDIGLVVVGLVLLTTGADWLVDGATSVAQALGLSELVVGLTIVAAGTSFPELATSLVATLRGERDLAVGNVVGSNIFNVLWVLGSAAIVSPDGIPIPDGVLTFDLPVMLAVAAACLPIFFTGWMLSRWEGALFLLYYVVYVVHLTLNAAGHEAEQVFGWVVVTFVIPLTVITTLVVWYRGRTPR